MNLNDFAPLRQVEGWVVYRHVVVMVFAKGLKSPDVVGEIKFRPHKKWLMTG
jgi:hypothetical protein